MKIAPGMFIYGQIIIVGVQLRLDSLTYSKVRHRVVDESPLLLIPWVDQAYARDEQGKGTGHEGLQRPYLKKKKNKQSKHS